MATEATEVSTLFQHTPMFVPLPPSQQHSSTLPNYPELIMTAIEALNEKEGSNKSSISRQIESTLADLPAAHTTLLSHHLNKMKQAGQLVFVKNNYMKPDPNAPPRRGRGRPPKPKTPLPPGQAPAPTAGAGASSPRPRGRPPKPRDPFAPPPVKKQSTPAGSGRPRGRPPKKAKTDEAAQEGAVSFAPGLLNSAAVMSPADVAASGVKRGRGRPPKAKPAVVPVAG